MPSRIVCDPPERNVAVLAHLNKEPDDGLLVLNLGLFDQAAHGQRVEHLTDGLRMVLREHAANGAADRGDRGLVAAKPFYSASTI